MQLYRYSADNNLQQIINKVLDTKTDSILVSWIQENEGDKEYNVEEPILIRFIYHTLLHKKAKEVLCDVVDLLSNKSITRTVFHMLLYYPDESIRTDVLVILAHMNGAVYDTYFINNKKIGQLFPIFLYTLLEFYLLLSL